MDLEMLRQQLSNWGVTPERLFAIGVLGLIGLFFSVRVVLKWYLGIQHLQDELRLIRGQLQEIEQHLAPAKAEAESTSPADAAKIESETFRLSH